MLNDPLNRLYQKVIGLQILFASSVAATALALAGGLEAVSAVVGGSAVVIGSCAYALIARESEVSTTSGKKVLGRHVLAEVTKIAATLIVALAAIASGGFITGWLVLSMAITLLGHGFIVFIIR